MNRYCSFFIKQLDNTLEKISNNTLRQYDLTLMQISILLTLKVSENFSVPLKFLEKSHHVAQSTMAGIIVRLEQKGLIESYISNEDKRIKMVRITKEGLFCCELCSTHLDDVENQILRSLTEEEKNEFKRLLSKVTYSIE